MWYKLRRYTSPIVTPHSPLDRSQHKLDIFYNRNRSFTPACFFLSWVSQNQTEIFNVVQRRIYIFKSFLLIDHSKEANCICTLTLTGTDGLCCSTIFSYIVAVSFIGGENLSTRRKPPTCCKSLTNFII